MLRFFFRCLEQQFCTEQSAACLEEYRRVDLPPHMEFCIDDRTLPASSSTIRESLDDESNLYNCQLQRRLRCSKHLRCTRARIAD